MIELFDEKLLEKISKQIGVPLTVDGLQEPNASCWIWNGATKYNNGKTTGVRNRGYGPLEKTANYKPRPIMRIGKKFFSPATVLWIHKHSVPPLGGLRIMCGHPLCINPEHRADLGRIKQEVVDIRGLMTEIKDARKLTPEELFERLDCGFSLDACRKALR